jgi:SagB-type dehydrogenase family enzyme
MYPRFERIIPDDEKKLNTTLEHLIHNRRSRRICSPASLDLKNLHQILIHSAGLTDDEFRAYPSAGARYPIEIYIIVVDVELMEPGIYHYSPSDNSIEILWLRECSEEVLSTISPGMNDFIDDVRAVVVMTSIDDRTVIKYGEEGRDFPLIEAGYVGANIVLLCEERGFNSVIIGTQWTKNDIAALIDIDSEKERVVSAIVIL